MSLSTESVVLLITTVAIAGIAVGVITGVSGQLAERVGFISEERAEVIESDMTVISDLGSDQVYDQSENELTLLVRNTGERRLETSRVNLFVDDQVRPIDEIEVISSQSDIWRPEDVVRIEATVDLDPGTRSIFIEKFGAEDDVKIFVN